MRSPTRLLSRISIRLMLFNLLLVFLPVAGILFIDIYERHLEQAQIDGMQRQGRLFVAMMQSDGKPTFARVAPLFRTIRWNEPRIRILNAEGRVQLDSGPLQESDYEDPESSAKRNWLYRVGVALLRKPLQWIRPVTHPLPSSEQYERSGILRGREVQAALLGRNGVEKRVSSAPGYPVTLYTATPVFQRGHTMGVVLVSQSTDSIRQDLHAVRLAVFQIFVASIAVAIVLTLMVSTTIVQPLRQLRKEAGEIADRRGRLRGRFKVSGKRDEIGDLSRALDRLTRRLEQHQQSIEAFASDVSHEFKNPLASIRMATEMLSQVEAPAERSRFLRIAESEIARMENLLSQVREITVIDAEIQKEQRTEVDLKQLLQRIVEGFRLREREAVLFDLQLPERPLTLSASEDRLIQVFENILDNAVSFSPRGSQVAIAADGVDHTIVVRIRDHGPGVAEENLDRIFDRFFTYRPEERRKHTGLGLSIVKAIVEGYGGTVTAANDAGGGAIFEVRL